MTTRVFYTEECKAISVEGKLKAYGDWMVGGGK